MQLDIVRKNSILLEKHNNCGISAQTTNSWVGMVYDAFH